MATVDQQTDLDRMLDYAIAVWAELPEIEHEFDEWDQLEQITFIEDWPPHEDQLARLARAAATGAMTPEQRRRYRELQELVERNRPIIVRLRG